MATYTVPAAVVIVVEALVIIALWRRVNECGGV